MSNSPDLDSYSSNTLIEPVEPDCDFKAEQEVVSMTNAKVIKNGDVKTQVDSGSASSSADPTDLVKTEVDATIYKGDVRPIAIRKTIDPPDEGSNLLETSTSIVGNGSLPTKEVSNAGSGMTQGMPEERNTSSVSVEAGPMNKDVQPFVNFDATSLKRKLPETNALVGDPPDEIYLSKPPKCRATIQPDQDESTLQASGMSGEGGSATDTPLDSSNTAAKAPLDDIPDADMEQNAFGGDIFEGNGAYSPKNSEPSLNGQGEETNDAEQNAIGGGNGAYSPHDSEPFRNGQNEETIGNQTTSLEVVDTLFGSVSTGSAGTDDQTIVPATLQNFYATGGRFLSGSEMWGIGRNQLGNAGIPLSTTWNVGIPLPQPNARNGVFGGRVWFEDGITTFFRLSDSGDMLHVRRVRGGECIFEFPFSVYQ